VFLLIELHFGLIYPLLSVSNPRAKQHSAAYRPFSFLHRASSDTLRCQSARHGRIRARRDMLISEEGVESVSHR
jgi:hypothetical protein